MGARWGKVWRTPPADGQEATVFLGTYPPRLDDKGRLALPAKFSVRGAGLVSDDDLPGGLSHISKIYQFLTVGSDLSLHCFLAATSTGEGRGFTTADVEVRRPRVGVKRKNYIHRIERSFVLPDSLSQRAALLQSRRRGAEAPTRRSSRPHTAVSLGHFFRRLVQGVDSVLARREGAPPGSGERNSISDPFSILREAIERASEESHGPLKPL